jgi:hypothetical protein
MTVRVGSLGSSGNAASTRRSAARATASSAPLPQTGARAHARRDPWRAGLLHFEYNVSMTQYKK